MYWTASTVQSIVVQGTDQDVSSGDLKEPRTHPHCAGWCIACPFLRYFLRGGQDETCPSTISATGRGGGGASGSVADREGSNLSGTADHDCHRVRSGRSHGHESANLGPAHEGNAR